jgi:hypothetical protein
LRRDITAQGPSGLESSSRPDWCCVDMQPPCSPWG